jgi:uncharacterized membrane protein
MNSLGSIIIIFSIYSFLGWILETMHASLRDKQFVNRGFLNGCFCPIYGLGAIITLNIFSFVNFNSYSFEVNMIIKFFLVILFITILEFYTGYILEKVFNCKWWDYSEYKDNIRGYVCIRYSALWGLLAIILIYFINPIINNFVISIPNNFIIYLSTFLILYFILDTMTSVTEALSLRTVILNYTKFSSYKYYDKIIQYKRIFIAFPKLLILNAGIINKDVRSIINGRIHKIKVEFKSRFL